MASEPSSNDREYDLWKKIADNLYELLISLNITDVEAPSHNDRTFDLMKKVTSYTCKLAEAYDL
jgi:hypothetical protein